VRNAPWPRKPERCLRPLVGLPVVPSGPFTARDDGDERFRTYLPLRPSRREALPPPAPLRTVHDTFVSYGSSPSTAPYGTRCPYGQIESKLHTCVGATG